MAAAAQVEGVAAARLLAVQAIKAELAARAAQQVSTILELC
jgi:hypothetical protein